jgi:hypothetical protein
VIAHPLKTHHHGTQVRDWLQEAVLRYLQCGKTGVLAALAGSLKNVPILLANYIWLLLLGDCGGHMIGFS